MKPAITVVVCTRNRHTLLSACLASLSRQTLRRDEFEVLVVDNGSTDPTPDVVSAFSAGMNARVFREPRIGLSIARNRGLREAEAAYIAYLDDDAEAEPTWLEQALEGVKTFLPAPDAMAGAILLKWEVPRPEWVTDEMTGPLGALWWGETAFRMSPGQRLIGANCFFKKSSLKAVGGFNEHLGRKSNCLLSGEETQVQDRFVDRGFCLWYNPRALVRHFVPRERIHTSWFYRRFFWGGISDYVQTCTSKVKSLSQDTTDTLYRRVLKHSWLATGLTLKKRDAVSGRIYLSYAMGRLWGPFYVRLHARDIRCAGV